MASSVAFRYPLTWWGMITRCIRMLRLKQHKIAMTFHRQQLSVRMSLWMHPDTGWRWGTTGCHWMCGCSLAPTPSAIAAAWMHHSQVLSSSHAWIRCRPQAEAAVREFLKALETTTAMKRRKISCSFGSDCWVSDSSFHGCWLGIVVAWQLLWVPLLPLNDGQVEKSSFHGCYRLGTPGGWIGTFKSRSFVVVVVSCAVGFPQAVKIAERTRQHTAEATKLGQEFPCIDGDPGGLLSRLGGSEVVLAELQAEDVARGKAQEPMSSRVQTKHIVWSHVCHFCLIKWLQSVLAYVFVWKSG